MDVEPPFVFNCASWDPMVFGPACQDLPVVVWSWCKAQDALGYVVVVQVRLDKGK